MPTGAQSLRAVDAFRSVFQVAPRMTNAGPAGTEITTSLWRTPWLDSYEIPENQDLIVGMHTGGTRAARTRLDGKWSAFCSKPGDLTLIPPGTPTAYQPKGEIEFLTVHIGRERLRTITEDERREGVPFRFAFRDPFVSGCLQALGDEMIAPRERGTLYVDSVIEALARHVVRPAAPNALATWRRSSLPRHVIARVCDRIEENLETGISLDELAREAGASRFCFARAFREATGVPPHRFLTMRRIEKAKELLRATDQSLVEIALATGFANQSHFTVRFRDVAGVTPKRFREEG